MSKHPVFLGVLLGLLGTFFYSLQTAFVKEFSSTLPSLPMIIFIQCSVAFLLMLPIMAKPIKNHGLTALKSHHLFLQILRAIFSLLLSFFLYYAVKFIPLVDAILLANASPLVVPFVAYAFFCEKINKRFWLPVIMGFIGVIVVLHPGDQIINFASIFAFAAAICAAISLVVVRHATQDSTNISSFYFFLLSTIFSGVIVLFYWEPITLDNLAVMVTIGICFFLFQYLVTFALKLTNAMLVSTLLYANIIFSAIMADLIWHETLSLHTYIGIALIVIGGYFCIRVENTPKSVPE